MILSTDFRLIRLLILTVFIASLYQPKTLFSQINPEVKHKNQPTLSPSDRIFFGGDLGIQFGTVTIINVSPLVGYRITPDLAAGIGITYQYYNDKRFDPDFSTSIYGGRIFGRYYILDNLFAHTEYEVLNYDAVFVDGTGSLFQDRITANNIYVGGGYRQPLGGKANLELMILYNINESAQSLYENPIIRMGITVGI